MPRQIKAIPATEEGFRKFGRLVPIEPAMEPIADNENLTCWGKVAEFDPFERSVYVLTEKRRPMVLTEMERHVGTAEWFTVVAGECVAAFALGTGKLCDENDAPDPDSVVAFKMDGVAAFLVDAGVWHWPAFPITETATQLVDVKTGTVEDDVSSKPLSDTVEIVL